jgi:tripartite-type tricarboxylate transporter receptor subunit TctC
MMGTTDISLESFKTVGIPVLDNSTVLAVHKDMKITKLPDLIEASKKGTPKKLEYGMKIGATNQICGIAMGVEWKSQFKNIDVGNNAAKMTALLARQTDVINIAYAVAKDYFKTGEFVPVVLLGNEKNPLLKDVPIASDSGLKNLDFGKFFWVGTNPNTPDEIVNILSDAMKKATEDPEFKEKMAANFLTVKYMNPKDAKDYAMKLFNDTMLPYKEEFLKK